MNTYRKRSQRPRQKPVYNILVNPGASGYSKEKIEFLTSKFDKSGTKYFLAETDSTKSAAYHTKRILGKRPAGIIACGGDGTVNSIARNLIRRTTGLGIFPLGRDNNIYRSLYGAPDADKAVGIIMSGKTKRIDYGLAGGNFFLGSIAFGLIPELFSILEKKKAPRLAIGWSRMAAQAAAAVKIKTLSIKVDAFKFEFSPRTLTINLLSNTMGLNLMPSCIPDDGKCEVAFDNSDSSSILSSYIRQIYKKKYVYGDDIRIFRGESISISPADKLRFYLDGEMIDWHGNDLAVNIVAGRIRVFSKAGQ